MAHSFWVVIIIVLLKYKYKHEYFLGMNLVDAIKSNF